MRVQQKTTERRVSMIQVENVSKSFRIAKRNAELKEAVKSLWHRKYEKEELKQQFPEENLDEMIASIYRRYRIS